AFIHLVVEGHIELRPLVRVALEAERRLRRLQQLFLRARMHAVAAYAAHIRLCVRRTIEVRMRARVTAQALLVHFFCRMLCWIENLCHIPAAIDVSLAGAVT